MKNTNLTHADIVDLSPEQLEIRLQSMDPFARQELLASMDFDRDPNTALGNSVDKLFSTAESQLIGTEDELAQAGSDELENRYDASVYDAVDVTAYYGGESSTITVQRLQDDVEIADVNKPKTIITLPVKTGEHHGVEFSESTEIFESKNGKWQKRITIELGDGAEEIFGTTSIDETVELSSQDLKDVYNMTTHPTKIRKHQRTGHQSGATATSIEAPYQPVT